MEGSSSYCYSSDSLSMFLIVPLLSLYFSSILKSSFSFPFIIHLTTFVTLNSLLYYSISLYIVFLLFLLSFGSCPFSLYLYLRFRYTLSFCVTFFVLYIWFYYVYMVLLCVPGFVVCIWFYYVYMVLLCICGFIPV
jgi:hypothetical protein